MPERLEDIIGNGFHTWTSNFNICIPLVINYLMQLLVMFFTFVVAMIIIFGKDLPDQMAFISDKEILELISSSIYGNITIVFILIILFFIITMLIDSYFRACAIGMCKNATIHGNTTTDDMFNYGKKSFIQIFLANLLLLLMMLVGILFIVPGALLLKNNTELMENALFGSGTMLIILGFIIWFIYMLIIQVVFSVVLYAVVVEETQALDGFRIGYEFFMDNKLSVLLIWLFCTVASISIAILFYFISNIINLAGGVGLSLAWSLSNQLIILLTLQPLIMIWWTRLYLVKTGKNIFIDELLLETWE